MRAPLEHFGEKRDYVEFHHRAISPTQLSRAARNRFDGHLARFEVDRFDHVVYYRHQDFGGTVAHHPYVVSAGWRNLCDRAEARPSVVTTAQPRTWK